MIAKGVRPTKQTETIFYPYPKHGEQDMRIFDWIRTNVSQAIEAGIRQGVTDGLSAVTSGQVTTIDVPRIEAKPEKPKAKKSK